MNQLSPRTNSILLRFFPFALVASMFVLFGYYAFHCPWLADDYEFQFILQQKNIPEASQYFYRAFNGRLASHFFLTTVIYLFRNSEALLFIYRFAMLFVFILSLAFLIRNYLAAFRATIISVPRSVFFSAFITAFLFFFFFSAKVEVWFWVSSTGVYLISLIIAMNGFALLFSAKQSVLNATLILFLFFLAGGFSETYAIMYLILLTGILIWFFRNANFLKQKTAAFFALAGIIAGLAINLSSSGTDNRLELLPDFTFAYALRNTVHSLAFPFLDYKTLAIDILLTAAFLLYAHFYFPAVRAGFNYFLKRAVIVLLFISASFFLPCFILSDIVPDRAASLGYFAGVLFLFDYFIFRSVDCHRGTGDTVKK
jgi:hypothetical protein